MQISLQEDNGIFFDGVPTLVVLVVKFDDGKMKRIPYPADKTIAALYEDLNAIADRVSNSPQEVVVSDSQQEFIVAKHKATKDTIPNLLKEAYKIDKSNIIEKEDIVTMIKMHQRDKGATCLLMVGMDYRVIECIGPRITLPGRSDVTQQIQSYDVIDDTAPTPERMRVFPDEIVLKSKRKSAVIEKTHVVEEILKCPECIALNSLVLDGTDFKGTCVNCGIDITIGRVIRKCQTAKCGQDVSCFDVGGKYQGSCGKCKAIVEVPYNA